MKYVAKKLDQNGHIHFTPEENETWKILFERQINTLQNRACDDFIVGLEKLNFSPNSVPQCIEVSETLHKLTGWSVVPVEAMISITDFFTLLSQRQFPAASFIRTREELDYLQEPDIFHELFGHCPLLTHPAYADFCERYGQMALKVSEEARSFLGRLFWYTIEFGLMNTSQGIRIYGGGILSSHQETMYALESQLPKRLPFNVTHMLNMPYYYDRIQPLYFVLDSLDQLFELKDENIIESVNGLATKDKQKNNFIIC